MVDINEAVTAGLRLAQSAGKVSKAGGMATPPSIETRFRCKFYGDRAMIGMQKLRFQIPSVALPACLIEIAKQMEMEAKRLAPKFSGQLAGSIKAKPVYKAGDVSYINVDVDSPYGVFQEIGFRTHRIGAYTPSYSGYRFIDWLVGKGFRDPRGRVKRWYWVSKNTPFLGPAFYNTQYKIPQIIRPIIQRELTLAAAGAQY